MFNFNILGNSSPYYESEGRPFESVRAHHSSFSSGYARLWPVPPAMGMTMPAEFTFSATVPTATPDALVCRIEASAPEQLYGHGAVPYSRVRWISHALATAPIA